MTHLLALVLAVPLGGALLLLPISKRQTTLIRGVAGLAVLVDFLLALTLWVRYDPGNAAFQFLERVPWIPAIGADFFLGVDGYSVLLIILTTLLGCVAVLASWTAITVRVKEYFALLLVLQAGVLGAFMALDFLLFFLFSEVVLGPLYLLLAFWGAPAAGTSARKYLFYMSVSGIALLTGLLTIYFYSHQITGVYSFDVTELHKLTLPYSVQWWAFIAFFVAFAIKLPLVPFHAWLADAEEKAPVAASVILGAVIVKLGTFGFLRFALPILPDATRDFVPYVALICLAGLAYGAVVGLAQTDWKRVLAYVSLAQMALVMLGMLALNDAGIAGSMLLQITHGLSIGALFVLAGFMYERRQTLAIERFGGLARAMPRFAALFLVVTMGTIGVPLLSGFVSERLILQGAYAAHKAWAFAAAGGIVLGAICLLSLYGRTMLGIRPAEGAAPPADLNGRELATVMPLVLLSIWIGVHPQPMLDRLRISAHHVVSHVNPAAGNAADCDTIPTPEKVEATPGAQFLSAVPCGPDGQPLEPATSAPAPAR